MDRTLILTLLLWTSCKTDPPMDATAIQAAADLAEEREQAVIDSVRTATITTYLDSLSATLPVQPTPLADLYERACEGVYLILSMNTFGEISQGTGFLINANGLLVTNYHVIEDMMQGAVVYAEGKYVEIDQVIRQDSLNDWAIIRVMPGLPPGMVLPLAREMPRIGEACFAIGNPLGLVQTLSTGVVSGYRGEKQLIQTTAEITHGSSGGPLFNQKGEVFGITSSGVGEANLNFAVNIRQVQFDDLIEPPVSGLVPYTDHPLKTRIRQSLEAYYAALLAGDIQPLANCYAPSVRRHYEEYVLSAQEAALADRETRWSRQVVPVAYKPEWERLILDPLEDGVTIRLPVIFTSIRGSDEGTREEERLYRLELDKEYKIRRVELIE